MTLGVGVIGYGVMGRTHAAAYQRLRASGLPVEVLGVASHRVGGDPGSATRGNLDAMRGDESSLPPSAARYPTAEALLSDPAIQAVSITTWTESHVPLALAALAAGRHVLVEKPVALTSGEVERLAAAVPPGLVCLPAFCMRYWPGWPWLREQVRTGALGRLSSLHLRRVGEPPSWAPAFYGDPARSGGALMDLHIHDADFVRWCFGDPVRINAMGTRGHVTTRYHFADGPDEVVAEGGHLPVPGLGFQMRYLAVFDGGVATFTHDGTPPLLLTRGNRVEPVPIPTETAYELQARHFVELCLGTATEPPRATLADAVAVTRLLEEEARALAEG